MTQTLFIHFIRMHQTACSKSERDHVRELARKCLTPSQYLDFLTDCIDYMYSLNKPPLTFKTDFETYP